MLIKLEDDLDHMKTVASEKEESEFERNHVIKVLEHESKVYKFEKNVIGNMAIDDMNPEYDQQDYDKYSDRDNERTRNDFDYRSVSNVSHSQRLSKRI